MLIESLEPLEDDYEAFRLEDNIHHLQKLQAMSPIEIVRDLRNHVTRIYQRDVMLLTILLTYCSPRWFIYDDDYVRGWLVSVIIGDTGTGKSQTFDRIAEFAGVGDMFSGLTGSRTGLAYALVEHKQKGWQVKIGRYPANTRKLLAVDEVQEIPDYQFKPIGKAMNEGFMQVDRVSSQGYESQTRLIMLGNPKKVSIMDDHTYGCVTLKGIFGNMIIRRIDIACLTNMNDIKVLELKIEGRDKLERQKVMGEELRALIYWAWNLRPEDIVISVDARLYCEDKGKHKIANVYGNATDVPLITRYEYQKTLMRLAVAFAVFDVSATTDFRKLLVKEEHVESAIDFLNALYKHDNCRLDTYSKLCKAEEEIEDYDEIKELIDSTIEKEKFAGDSKHLFRRLLKSLWLIGARDEGEQVPIKRQTLADMTGCSPDYISKKIRLLSQVGMIDAAKKSGYKKQAKFVRFLREFLKERPDFFDIGSKKISADEFAEGSFAGQEEGRQEKWWEN